MNSTETRRTESEENTCARSQREYLGDDVYAEEDGGMICLSGNAFGRENVIYLEHWVYAALRQWAQAHGYEPVPRSGDAISQS